jgi:hypothetical protein
MLAKLEPLPDEENAALLIRKLTVPKLNEPFNYGTAGRLFGVYPPNARLNDAQMKHIEAHWQKIRPEIEAARRLKDMPRGRLPFDEPLWETLKKRTVNTAFVMDDWLRHDAMRSAQNGDLELASENCLALLNVSWSIKDEPGFFTALRRSAHHQNAVTTLERVLAQGTLPKRRLANLQTGFEAVTAENLFLQGARGERNWRHLYFERMFDGDILGDELAHAARHNGAQSWWNQKFPSTLLQHCPEDFRHMNQLVEVAKAPIHERGAKLTAHLALVAKTGTPLAEHRSSQSAHEIDLQTQGLLRSAIAALACERYRIDNNNWPVDLDAVVKEKYLTSLPLDPVNGVPLRFRHTQDGVVIYSIGKNEMDEQGAMRRHGTVAPAGKADDQGFRLWDVPHRAQPPVDPTPKAKKRPRGEVFEEPASRTP